MDNDAWRLWPSGDRWLQKDKQFYRDLKEITSEALDELVKNFQWVADECAKLGTPEPGHVVVFSDTCDEHQSSLLSHLERVWGALDGSSFAHSAASSTDLDLATADPRLILTEASHAAPDRP